MKKILLFLILSFLSLIFTLKAQTINPLDTIMPIRGFCIGQPQRENLDAFMNFVEHELAPRKINTLILRVDYHYKYVLHPELRDSNALTREEVKKLVHLCQRLHINLIPQINMLGHQSWENHVNPLLTKYPEFDETPWVKNPDVYAWPNEDNLYCRSYCPLHPGIHKILFELIDEICDAYEATDFHAGMDEVFYLGEDKCPRCGGWDKAELFSDEVRRIHDHLERNNRHLWIWGDRLLDGKTTRLGIWEASFNNSYRAIDMIPKDVMICDWHYDRAEKTAAYFAIKGLNVVSCPWENPSLGVQQAKDMIGFRKDSDKEIGSHFNGIVQTIWSSVDSFLDEYYHGGIEQDKINTQANCFRMTMNEILGYK